MDAAIINASKFYERDGKWWLKMPQGEIRVGNQIPQIDIYQDGLIYEANDALRLVRNYGNALFKWQVDTIRRWLAVDESGALVNVVCGLEVPRQNGKTEMIIARILHGMITRGERIVFTAQSEATVDVIKARVLEFFYETTDDDIKDLLSLRFRKRKPTSLNYLELVTGGRCLFMTRTRITGLGQTNDLLIVDEAQELTEAQSDALTPSISASRLGNPQVIYLGTPPEPGGTGFVFSSVRDQATSKQHQICWREWGVKNLHDPHDVEKWYETNPSLNLTINEDTVRRIDLIALSYDGFNRQRLGWWAGVESKRAITDSQWRPLGVDQVELPPEPDIVLAVKIAPDRGEMSLALAAKTSEDNIHVEIIDSKEFSIGYKWAIDFISEHHQKANAVIIDGWYGKQIIEDELIKRRVPNNKIRSLALKEIADAHVFFYEAIEKEEVTHYNQPGLNTSAANVKRRIIGKFGGFGWESMSSDVSSAPLDAVTLAYWGAKTLPSARKTRRKQRMRM